MKSQCPTTIDFPVELPAARHGDHWIARAADTELRLTNLHKVFWPEAGYTKGDLLSYYFNVSQTILPHLRDRPLTLKRMPEGVVGPYFYEKDAPRYKPPWVPTIDVKAQTENRTIRAVSVCDVASLLWVANLGCIEFHPLHARGPEQKRPSYALFDLDPFPPAGLDEAKHVAVLVKTVLEQLGLPSYPKTSGATGIQVFVPLDETHTFEDVRRFVGSVCELIYGADPETTTLQWEVSKRGGKVFLDANMNRAQASAAAAYSARAEWNATVSAPFAWNELDDIDPEDFTIATMLDRLAVVGDLFGPVAHGPRHSLTDAMKQVAAQPRRRGR